MSSNILDGVVAFLQCGSEFKRGAVEKQLASLGARTVKRFGKDVTHIIFQRTHQATAAEKLEDDSKLLQWYEKAAQDEVVVSIVSPLWVQQSLDEKRRAMEKPHILPKPKNILLNHKLTTRTPGSGHGTGRKAKRRRASPGPAKSQQPIDTGAAIFSSSQLIRGADLEAAGPANKHLSGALVDLDEVSSPAAKRRATAKKAPAHLQKQPKTGGSAAKRGRSAAFTVTQQAAEPSAAVRAIIGAETQAAADMLLDLGLAPAPDPAGTGRKRKAPAAKSVAQLHLQDADFATPEHATGAAGRARRRAQTSARKPWGAAAAGAKTTGRARNQRPAADLDDDGDPPFTVGRTARQRAVAAGTAARRAAAAANQHAHSPPSFVAPPTARRRRSGPSRAADPVPPQATSKAPADCILPDGGSASKAGSASEPAKAGLRSSLKARNPARMLRSSSGEDLQDAGVAAASPATDANPAQHTVTRSTRQSTLASAQKPPSAGGGPAVRFAVEDADELVPPAKHPRPRSALGLRVSTAGDADNDFAAMPTSAAGTEGTAGAADGHGDGQDVVPDSDNEADMGAHYDDFQEDLGMDQNAGFDDDPGAHDAHDPMGLSGEPAGTAAADGPAGGMAEAPPDPKAAKPRWSQRHLRQHADKPLVLEKSTPPDLPPTPALAPAGADVIPIPVVNRVDSPWANLDAIAPTPADPAGPSTSDPSANPVQGVQAGAAGQQLQARGKAPVTGRQPAAGRKSKATPSAACTAGGALPTPWSTIRVWDSLPAAAQPDPARPLGGSHAQRGQQAQQQQAQDEHPDEFEEDFDPVLQVGPSGRENTDVNVGRAGRPTAPTSRKSQPAGVAAGRGVGTNAVAGTDVSLAAASAAKEAVGPPRKSRAAVLAQPKSRAAGPGKPEPSDSSAALADASKAAAPVADGGKAQRKQPGKQAASAPDAEASAGVAAGGGGTSGTGQQRKAGGAASEPGADASASKAAASAAKGGRSQRKLPGNAAADAPAAGASTSKAAAGRHGTGSKPLPKKPGKASKGAAQAGADASEGKAAAKGGKGQQTKPSKAAAPAAQAGAEIAAAAADVDTIAGAFEADDSMAAGPSQGCISLSSVDSEMQELCRAGVRRLRGLRMCPEGHEERTTHLIVGAERRTLKVLLAIAQGAWLLSPSWITASLEAGQWLPEAPFQAKVRFAAAAARSRKQHSDPSKQPLLHGAKVHVAETSKQGGATSNGAAGNGAALRKLVAALGGKVVGARAAVVCVVSGGGTRPSGLPSAVPAVREEWLLQAAEAYQLQPADRNPWVLE